MKTIANIIHPLFALFAFACFALLQNAQAVVPPPDGGYANQNTAEGQDALRSLTSGSYNTAIGFQALYFNTTGVSNAANGALALHSNTTGARNTAYGTEALLSNIDGLDNTAIGFQALYSNTSGGGNNAFGFGALSSNISGIRNLAVGSGALGSLTSGDSNVAVGNIALFQGVTVNFNTALGRRALFRSQGDQNIGIGYLAGQNLTTGDNNIDIGNDGVADEAGTIRIGTQGTQTQTFVAGISGVAVTGSQVFVSSSGQLGVRVSSERFKDEIKPMDKASEAILALKPVTFRYKKGIDADRTPQFGLIAEDVEKVNPALVASDADGKVYTVRYEAVNAMLLNEFLKEHKKVEEQQATIAELKSTVAEQRKHFEAISAQQHKEIQTLTASLKEQASQIQKVSAQIEIGKFTTGRIRRGGHAPQMVLNNQ